MEVLYEFIIENWGMFTGSWVPVVFLGFYLKRNQKRNDKAQKRLEFLILRWSDAKNRMAIQSTFDEYKKMGGNSYLDDVYNSRHKEYVEKNLSPRSKEGNE